MNFRAALMIIKTFAVKNAPMILTVTGAVGTVAAVCASSNSATKAHRLIKEAELTNKGDLNFARYNQAKTMAKEGMTEKEILRELEIEDRPEIIKSSLSVPDKAWIYIKSYAPTAIITAGALACIFGANHVNKKRLASLAATCMASEKALKEYKGKVNEIVGDKNAQKIDDDIIQDRMNANPASKAQPANILSNPNMPSMSLWYDIYSDRYFYTNADMIRRAELDVQELLRQNNFINVNEVYAILGVKEIPLGEYIGWERKESEDVQVRLIIGSDLDDNGVPMGTMDMNINVRPSDIWCGEV